MSSQWPVGLSKTVGDTVLSIKEADAILDFWFEQATPKQWFFKDLAFDALIEQRFGSWVRQALNQELTVWTRDADTSLALILLLDQFTRHIFRDAAQAFKGDPQALALSTLAVDRGWVADNQNINHRRFYLMPMMHSEEAAVQRASLALFAMHTDHDTLHFAQRHLAIIEKFGRFPHRNQALGRQSSSQELAFLAQPGSSF